MMRPQTRGIRMTCAMTQRYLACTFGVATASKARKLQAMATIVQQYGAFGVRFELGMYRTL
jgi:hypothetical protein